MLDVWQLNQAELELKKAYDDYRTNLEASIYALTSGT